MTQSTDVVGEALERFLQSPPDGTPDEVIRAFGPFRQTAGSALAPHVFYELVEQAPVAVAITDPAATILHVNRAFEALTGYAREELIGNNQSMLSNRMTPKSVYKELWATIKDKRAWSGKLLNRRKNGEVYLADLTISPVLDHEGNISNFLGMHGDITEVHQLQQQMRHQKALFELVLDAAPVLVALVDAKGRVILDNQEYKKLIADLPGRQPASVLLQAVEAQIGTAFGKGAQRPRDFHNVEVRIDGFPGGHPRWFSCSGTWLEDPDVSAKAYFKQSDSPERSLILIATEVSAQRRANERSRIQQLRATLAEQRLARGMREAMAAATFHIQKPINVINAASVLFQRSQLDSTSLLAVLEQIAQSAGAAIETLGAAVPTATDEASVSINLNELMQDVMQLTTEKLLAAGIIVDWQPDRHLPALAGRPNELRGAFMYLVENAIQAIMESRGGERTLRISTAANQEMVEVQIRDTGKGFGRELASTIFEPFFTAWAQSAGHAGMGLTIAQEIVNRHRGDLMIESQPGGGCQVRVQFPLAG